MQQPANLLFLSDPVRYLDCYKRDVLTIYKFITSHTIWTHYHCSFFCSSFTISSPMIYLSWFLKLLSLLLWQLYDCFSANKVTLMDMGKIDQYEATNKNNKVWTVSLFLVKCKLLEAITDKFCQFDSTEHLQWRLNTLQGSPLISDAGHAASISSPLRWQCGLILSWHPGVNRTFCETSLRPCR